MPKNLWDHYLEETAEDGVIDTERVRSFLTADGAEVPDPTPMAPPIGYKKQPSLAEQIRDMVRSERLAQEALASDHETFEEADDFEVGDDFEAERHSPWEGEFEPIQEVNRQEAEKNSKVKAARPERPQQPPEGPKAKEAKASPPQPKDDGSKPDS